MKRSIATIAAVAILTLIFPFAASPRHRVAASQKNPPVFDLCIQDDSGSPILRVNTTTGHYQFDDCEGTLLAGFGKVSRYYSIIGLGFTNGDFKAQFSIDTNGKTASGWIRDRVTGQTVYTIVDSNYSKGNTCSCP